ncbi:MAG TPA: tRNA (N6-isopentenyl adenosine(37)-C2)-methylthiotransferase MiaB [Candidatus Marinimicrobia bacterium]|jgi:tRNA-2-methylthio-N6-dimethylallyladenosine synthase|nr:tRNA (N6-isopentenyl adenosine(37)-C2)-methylthiotransferase MiaB [Candidatus Neomarinimicrobiota bacterium]MDP7217289.1 tRNA (N6-isopentenyl adenosine(37)-C2)-methylthiotransferase MiaB [Candidatus Neomarinimicrobiota bacterium]MDP7437026.1 tRNA (N6-isopentenyl adenosine(37)-C2)-methylthiotransferase MiaB [Candidatus Neomarinimicrobiota bacterium]HBN44880.1 tRNA (N6-isopentenyl adenosine(37)-C2)-methylthiotransferase MiaB [Candidatus Neomarinimicrobiota bacterium]HJL74064.1 tRNA (N6-isopent|tara:strand:+ start:6570 stop:7898 length:1329 start_codon:yes stop_codon:yes gene_type:complete
MHKSYIIETFGCQMNVADSELVEGLLQKEGYQPTNEIKNADAIFVNTCAIREHAEEKVHSQLGRYNLIKKQKPDTIIGVLGCMAQNLKDDLLENRPYVDIILGPDSYRKLPEILNRKMGQSKSIVDTKLSKYEVYADMFPSRNEGINAWVSIMRGCDKFCTFCIVPFTRGRERSRSIPSIIAEIEQAVADGFVEITLLGQNVNSYKYEQDGFAELLAAAAQVNGVQRIRYTSPHPQDINTELLAVMAEHDTICNYIHLPLQAGSNRILKRMNRTYSKEHFIGLSDHIRDMLPDVGISTDIIVGFPGETNDEFAETLEVMDRVKFDSAFTFKYSSRPGTKAAEYSDHIPEEEKKKRLQRVIALQKKHTLERNLKNVSKVETVLVEKESKKSANHWAGRTDANKWVIFEKGNSKIKDFVPVLITAAKGVSLHGELVHQEKAHAV